MTSATRARRGRDAGATRARRGRDLHETIKNRVGVAATLCAAFIFRDYCIDRVLWYIVKSCGLLLFSISFISVIHLLLISVISTCDTLIVNICDINL